MALKEILALIDAEIASLEQAKSLLSHSAGLTDSPVRRKPGRPAKSASAVAPAGKKKRNLSPEGRARIAEAVKRRWAAQKTKQKKA
jgi:hypothetical protein